jgi:hypothetical protein
MNCEACGQEVTATGKRGRPRRFCSECLPSINEIGRPAHQARYTFLTGESDELGTGADRAPVACAVLSCTSAASNRGLCATHAARRAGRSRVPLLARSGARP